MNRASVLGAAVLCLSAIGWTEQAHALNCADLPNPLVVSGSTAVAKVIGAVAPVLAGATGADQISIVYKGSGSCSGIIAIAKDVTPTGACATADACLTGTAQYWTAATGTAAQTCDLAASGTHIDVSFSDVYKETCEGVPAASLVDQSMLVLPFGLIVAKASTQEAIDAREGYYVYGRGMSAGITPWVNEALLFRRDGTSGTQITTLKALHVPTGSTIGVDTKGTSGMITQVGGASAPEQSLGFAGLDAVDLVRDSLKILAYRHWGQSKFYWPDSTSTSYDKKNVRDGHYPIWGYEHAVTLTGGPRTALAKKLADILSGTVALPGGDAIVLEAKQGVVPLCAMDVSRTTDGGDFSLVTTGESCSCLFEKNVPGGSTSCKTCTADTDCSTGQHCRKTFCEAR